MAAAKLSETVYHQEQGAHDQFQLTAAKTQTLKVGLDDHSTILVKFHVECVKRKKRKDEVDAMLHEE